MISVTIITLNEEKNIANLLKSLQGFADEIIVVDCGSNDNTVETAKKLKARVFFREFDNFANQKNWAASKSAGDWILSLDGDEQIPDQLKQEINEAVKNNLYNGYLIPRRNFILGKEIKYSRWSPDKHIWLWKKEFGKWVGDVHEELEVSGMVGELKNSKIHNSSKNVTLFIESNNKYSQLEANSIHKNKINFSFKVMLWQSFFEFFIRFVYKKGFLDGKRGFILSYLMAIYKLMVSIKLWELNKSSKD